MYLTQTCNDLVKYTHKRDIFLGKMIKIAIFPKK